MNANRLSPRIFVALVAAVTAFSIFTPAAAGAPWKTATGAISGTVLTPDGLTAFPGVTVTAYQNTSVEATAFMELVARGRAVTDATGAYRIARLPVGEYRVKLTPPDLSSAAWRWYDDDDMSGSPWHAEVVMVTTSPTALGANQLFLPGTISGHVDAVGGGGVAGLDIQLFVQAMSRLEGVASTVTDSNGDYTFSGVPPSAAVPPGPGDVVCYAMYGCELAPLSYMVWAHDLQGWWVASNWDNPVADLGEGGSIVMAPLALDPASRASGAVQDTRGRPVVGAEVFAVVPTFDGWAVRWEQIDAWASTDSKGRFTIGALPLGTAVRIGVRDPRGKLATEYWPSAPAADLASTLPLLPGQTYVLPTRLVLEPAATATGVITGPDFHAVGGVTVHAMYETASGFVDILAAWTDDYGAYVLAGLPAGTYRFQMDTELPGGYWYAEEWREQPFGGGDVVVLVGGETRSGIDAWLDWAIASFTGTVTFGPGGPPVSNASVELLRQGLDGTQSMAMVWTDQDGTFSFDVAVRAGSYTLHAIIPSQPDQERWIGVGWVEPGGTLNPGPVVIS